MLIEACKVRYKFIHIGHLVKFQYNQCQNNLVGSNNYSYRVIIIRHLLIQF